MHCASHSQTNLTDGFVFWVDRTDRGPISKVNNDGLTDSRDISGAYYGIHVCNPSTLMIASNVLVTYTGRIDNRAELAVLLRKPDLAWASDGELFVASHSAWGDEFPSRVHGEYSFALLERNTGRLLAGRDAIGVHKLTYFEDDTRFWVSSDLDLLLKVLPRRPDYDLDGFCYFLAYGSLLGLSGHTLYKSIRYLPAAHTVAHAGLGAAARLQRYWAPDLNSVLVLKDSVEYDSRFRDLLFESVSAALRCKGTVCLELSGGLDSSSVTAASVLLQKQLFPDKDIFAYSMAASETEQTDETPYWRAMLAQYPVEHHVIDIDKIPDGFSPIQGSQPSLIDAQTWGNEVQKRIVAARAPQVCLTGQGGDAVLCYSMPPFHLAEYLRRLDLANWGKELRSWLGSGRYNLWKLLSVFSRGDVVRALGRPPTTPRWLGSRFRGRFEAAQSSVFTDGAGRFISNPRIFHYHLISLVASSLPDRSKLLWELRAPLLARPLVEFMLSVPAELKTTASCDRVLQRRALKGILPDEVRMRRNKGDFTPRFFLGLRRNWNEWEPLTDGTCLADFGLIDPVAFRAACERLRHGKPETALSYFIAALLLERWLRSQEKQHQAQG